MGGRIHSKGVMILSGLLKGRYAQDVPLSLSASLVLNNPYGGVDGDSAFSRILYAVKQHCPSSEAKPGSYGLRQSTWSSSSFRRWRLIRKLKVLMIFAKMRLPATKVSHLGKYTELDALFAKMLNRAANFISILLHMSDEGIQILTGIPAGEKLKDGQLS